MPTTPTYREWMARSLGADDKYGDVAGEFVPDPTWRDDITTVDEMQDYLTELGVADSFRDVVTETFERYLAEIGNAHPSGASAPTTEHPEESPH